MREKVRDPSIAAHAKASKPVQKRLAASKHSSIKRDCHSDAGIQDRRALDRGPYNKSTWFTLLPGVDRPRVHRSRRRRSATSYLIENAMN